jgi:hypothetical protein
METWMPARLPARFRPRGAERGRIGLAARRAWLPVASGAAVLLAATLACISTPAPATFVRLLAGRSEQPSPTPAQVAAAPPHPWRGMTAAQVPAQRPPAGPVNRPRPSSAASAIESPPPALASAQPTGMLQVLVPTPTPSASPSPSPSPEKLCLPLKLTCI